MRNALSTIATALTLLVLSTPSALAGGLLCRATHAMEGVDLDADQAALFADIQDQRKANRAVRGEGERGPRARGERDGERGPRGHRGDGELGGEARAARAATVAAEFSSPNPDATVLHGLIDTSGRPDAPDAHATLDSLLALHATLTDSQLQQFAEGLSRPGRPRRAR
jgi:hypothetical protein